jgi:DNA-binding transcriptional regulator YiaG
MLQEEFAADLGCSIAALSAWENGQTQPGRLAERALHDVADEHGWTVDLQVGTATQRHRRGTAVAD